MSDKIKQLVDNFPSNVDAILIISRLNRFYFTNFDTTLGYVFITRDNSFYLLDQRYSEEATKIVKNCEIVQFTKVDEILEKLINKLGVKSVAIESEGISFAEAKQLTYKLSNWGAKPVYDGTLDKQINDMRAIKDDEEIRKIAIAQELNNKIFEHIVPYIKPGVTERDLALEMEFFGRKHGASKVSFDFIVVSGKNSSLPHGNPTDKKLEYGDFLTMDFGCIVNGYCGDMTRTVAVSGVSKEMEKVYNIVLQAQLRAINAIKSGVPCKDVDNEAREYIYDAGFEGYFGHGTGHCIGVNVHENPRCSMYSEDILKTNMVTSVEPGIYIPGKFGVRIEDLVVVKEDGCLNITRTPKELMIV